MIDTILNRRSVRNFKNEKVEKEKIDLILKAGINAPSCLNLQDWRFIVVDDTRLLNQMADINGPAATPLRGASFAVLVVGDLDKSYEKAKDYWIIDCALAAENMIIAASALGVGSVFLGTYPQEERVEGQRKLFNMPNSLVPHSIIAFGYEDPSFKRRDKKVNEDVITYNKI